MTIDNMNNYQKNIENFKIEQQINSCELAITQCSNLKEYIDLINNLEIQFWKIHRKTLHREQKHILKKGRRIKVKQSKKDEQLYDLYLQYFAQELYLIKKTCIQGFYIQSYSLIRSAFETIIQIYYSKIIGKDILYREIQKNKFSIAIKDMFKKLYGEKSKNFEFYSMISEKSHPTIKGLGFQGQLNLNLIEDIFAILINLYYYGFILIYEHKHKFFTSEDLKITQKLLDRIMNTKDIRENGLWEILPQNRKNLLIKDIPIQLI